MTENQMGGLRTAAKDEGSDVAQHAKEAAGQVGSTVRDQAAQVTQQTADQARHVVHDVRDRVAAEAEQQATRVSKQLGRIADELGEMVSSAPPDSLSAGAIKSAADTSRQAARFLDERGAQGLLDSARDYARRKPGTFLLGAAVAGFLVGRIAKSATGGSQGQGAQSQGVPSQGVPSQIAQGQGAQHLQGEVPVATGRPAPTPDFGAPLTPSTSPGLPAAGVPHVEP